MVSIPGWVIEEGVRKIIDVVKDSSKKEEKKPEEKKPADEEKSKQEPKKEYKKGGKVMDENMMLKKEGRGMAKASMEKVASKAVKGHEKRMHGMKAGGTVSSASKRADGCATKGKTRGKMV